MAYLPDPLTRSSDRGNRMDTSPQLNLAIASEVHDALIHVKRAEINLRHAMTPEREAVQRELAAVETGLCRVLNLVGGGSCG